MKVKIKISGPVGCGKTTMMKQLREFLVGHGITVKETDDICGTQTYGGSTNGLFADRKNKARIKTKLTGEEKQPKKPKKRKLAKA